MWLRGKNTPYMNATKKNLCRTSSNKYTALIKVHNALAHNLQITNVWLITLVKVVNDIRNIYRCNLALGETFTVY